MATASSSGSPTISPAAVTLSASAAVSPTGAATVSAAPSATPSPTGSSSVAATLAATATAAHSETGSPSRGSAQAPTLSATRSGAGPATISASKATPTASATTSQSPVIAMTSVSPSSLPIAVASVTQSAVPSLSLGASTSALPSPVVQPFVQVALTIYAPITGGGAAALAAFLAVEHAFLAGIAAALSIGDLAGLFFVTVTVSPGGSDRRLAEPGVRGVVGLGDGVPDARVTQRSGRDLSVPSSANTGISVIVGILASAAATSPAVIAACGPGGPLDAGSVMNATIALLLVQIGSGELASAIASQPGLLSGLNISSAAEFGSQLSLDRIPVARASTAQNSLGGSSGGSGGNGNGGGAGGTIAAAVVLLILVGAFAVYRLVYIPHQALKKFVREHPHLPQQHHGPRHSASVAPLPNLPPPSPSGGAGGGGDVVAERVGTLITSGTKTDSSGTSTAIASDSLPHEPRESSAYDDVVTAVTETDEAAGADASSAGGGGGGRAGAGGRGGEGGSDDSGTRGALLPGQFADLPGPASAAIAPAALAFPRAERRLLPPIAVRPTMYK